MSTMAVAPQATEMQLIQLIFGKWVSKAISVAAELGIADHLKGGPKTAEELARRTGAHAPSLYRLLRALTTVGIFEETGGRRFDLTPLAEHLRSDAPVSMRSMARMNGAPWTWKAWGRLDYCVRTGASAMRRTVGDEAFDHLAEHPEDAAVFDAAMDDYTRLTAPAIAGAYDFGRFRRIVDVAGGRGGLLTAILREYPGPEGIVFDLPHVIAGTRAAIRDSGLEDRCSVASGDFFDSVPAGADAYILKHIVHDWDDERALQILKNCRAAITGDGRLLVCEVVVPGPGESSLAKLLDLEMLVIPGGRERTGPEYRDLLARAGFRLLRIHPTESPVSVIEAAPMIS